MSIKSYCVGLTDAQLINVAKDEYDRYQRYLFEASGNEDGYRVQEIREDYEAAVAVAAERGITIVDGEVI